MPIYEFTCLDCEKEFEMLFRGASDRRKPVCPSCRSRNVQKQFSVFGMRSGRGKPTGGSSCAGCKATSCATCRN